MLSHQKKIAFIRAKCIASNPQIKKEQERLDNFFAQLDHLPCDAEEAFGELPSQDRPIRLSDVLNAIMHAEPVVCIASNERFELFDKAKNEWVQQFKTWYLANDDLNEQSEETISFLYDVLK